MKKVNCKMYTLKKNQQNFRKFRIDLTRRSVENQLKSIKNL